MYSKFDIGLRTNDKVHSTHKYIIIEMTLK